MSRRNSLVSMSLALLSSFLAASLARAAEAADNELTAQEKQDGWVLLFDGRSPDGWVTGGKPLPAANIQDGAINPYKAGAYVTYHKERLSDFILSCDFKVSPGANSGLFFRLADQGDPVQTGFEMQVFDSAGRPLGKHTCGAIYDAQAPSANAVKPAGEWNQVVLTADKNIIKVVLNGQQVIEMDLDRWTEAGKNPDGSKNKFKAALKNFPRRGHIGFQDHGQPVWFKNVKVKKLK
jgi:hypothetical protein